MISIDDLPFLGHITEVEEIDSGREGIIYRLSTTQPTPFPLCAKIMRAYWDDDESSRLKFLGLDAFFNQALYNAAVSVPRPVGLFRVLLPSSSSPVPAFIREYVGGDTYYQLSRDLKKKAVKIHAREKEIAVQRGFIPAVDCVPNQNCLYTVNDEIIERVTLFDFSYWKVRE